MSTQPDINAFRAQRIANIHDPLILMENTQTMFHPDQSSHITYLQHPQPNNNFGHQPSFNTNYMPQPIKNLEDSSDPTTSMNKALALIAKAFKLNTILTNNNQRSSLIPRNSQITQPDINTSLDIKMQMVDDNVGNQVRQNVVQNDGNEVGKNAVQNPGIQNVENMNGLSVILEIANQYGNGNVVTTPAEGNGNGINDAYEETKRVKVNFTSEDTLQQASTSGTQSDNALVYDSDRSTEVPKDENYYDYDIFNMLTHEVQFTDLQTELDRTKEKLENCIIKKEKEYVVLWNNWYIKCEECKYDKISYDKAYNDMQKKIKRLQAQLGDLKGKSSDTQCASNTLDLVSQKLEDKNVPLEFQVWSYAKENEHLKKTYKNLLDSIKVYEQKGTTKGTRVNTMFTKQLILGKPPSSSYKSKLYSVTPFTKSSVLLKVDKMNALSKPVTSNSAPSTRESKVTANHDVCVLNYVNDMNSHADNQSANVTIHENQKKYNENSKNSKELGSKGSHASSRPSKPRTCLRWIPTGRIFAMCGKLTASSNTENKSKKSVCDNASTSNPLEPSSKGFMISTYLLGRLSRLRKQYTSIYSIVVL
ncbi:hypothetical protein Tco_0890265 [Tanacetum coccineum]|uniref:Uncharacterized protein n=1 Tax=Tanacetum coccineum TaxID=301880 RepID=A0ABQ5C317_9ASTR